MRVGIDHHPARTHAPGVGRYSRELVRALVRLLECPELVLLDLGRGARAIGEPALGLADAPRRPRVIGPDAGLRRLLALGRAADARAGGLDVVHRMLPGRPRVRAARRVLAVAELDAPGSERDRALRADLEGGDAIVFSAQTARRLAERFGVPPERVHATPVGCDHWLRDLPREPVARGGVPSILVLGAPHPRRRPERVLRALEALVRRRPARLHLVGPRKPATEAFARGALAGSRAREHVVWTTDAREPDMAAVLASSSALVHLCADEETAVTPLEGLCFGLPVVASRIPPFEADLGADAHLVSDDEERDPEALADALAAALDARDDAAAVAARRAHAARFTWEACARATVAAYRRIAARGA